jgi:hypothetical protein
VYLGQTHPLVTELPDVADLSLYPLVLTGQTEVARAEIRRRLYGLESYQEWSRVRGVRILECAMLLRDLEMVKLCLDKLQQLDTPPTLGPWLGNVDRLLADASVATGDHSGARALYEKAIGHSTRMGHRPELALSRLGLAEVLLDHYTEERDAAIEHLDFAIAEFREMKMQPALERALRHRGLLKA